MIRRHGSRWRLMTADGTRVLGEHPTREAAERQEAAVEASKARRGAKVDPDGGGAVVLGDRPPPRGLLETPVRDLHLQPTGLLASCLRKTLGELRARGVGMTPRVELGDPDFWTADRGVNVNVPWFLATPELWRLAAARVWPYDRRNVEMFLRHEFGHAVLYAYELWRRPDWGEVFGDFSAPYRDDYRPDPAAADDHVLYLHWAGLPHYAQKHPDEDWAETFAALMSDPAWARTYADRPGALAKLRYAARVVPQACSGPPLNERPGLSAPYTQIAATVGRALGVTPERRRGLRALARAVRR